VNIAVIEDYGHVFRRSPAYERLTDHNVVVHTEAETDLGKLAAKLADPVLAFVAGSPINVVKPGLVAR
jgi:hypothetical protein